MATKNATGETRLDYRVRFDVEADEYPWKVLDADNDEEDCFDTEAEAQQAADQLNADAQTDRDEEERCDLAARLADHMDTLDLDVLRALAKQLKLKKA